MLLICKLICLFLFLWFGSTIALRARVEQAVPAWFFIVASASAVAFAFLQGWIR